MSLRLDQMMSNLNVKGEGANTDDELTLGSLDGVLFK